MTIDLLRWSEKENYIKRHKITSAWVFFIIILFGIKYEDLTTTERCSQIRNCY